MPCLGGWQLVQLGSHGPALGSGLLLSKTSRRKPPSRGRGFVLLYKGGPARGGATTPRRPARTRCSSHALGWRGCEQLARQEFRRMGWAGVRTPQPLPATSDRQSPPQPPATGTCSHGGLQHFSSDPDGVPTPRTGSGPLARRVLRGGLTAGSSRHRPRSADPRGPPGGKAGSRRISAAPLRLIFSPVM